MVDSGRFPLDFPYKNVRLLEAIPSNVQCSAQNFQVFAVFPAQLPHSPPAWEVGCSARAGDAMGGAALS